MPNSYLMSEHSYRWHHRDGSVWIYCNTCGVQSPYFDAIAEWEKLKQWANEHSSRAASE